MNEYESYFLDITWDREGMPSHVGPFATRVEADEWAALSIPNGSWEVVPLSWPYMVAKGKPAIGLMIPRKPKNAEAADG